MSDASLIYEFMTEVGLTILGDCGSEPLLIYGKLRLPSSLGRYSIKCDANPCPGFQPRVNGSTDKVCGNCKCWTSLPKGDIDSYE